MPFLPQDERHLSRALDLARKAVGLASPNPTVGCVLANGPLPLSEGAHHYEEFDHAEIVALKKAVQNGVDVRGATAYVTLEPCSHHGRTGPCADALVAAGIARCVVATLDPNPRVSGGGVAKLRAAGISVDVCPADGAIAQAARRLNDAFAFSIQHGRPFVRLKAALSVDGKLAPARSDRTELAPYWLTGPAARDDVQQLRHSSDALVTGIGTVLADDPSLTDRTGLPRRRALLRVVLDSQLNMPASAKLLINVAGDVLIFCATTASTEREATLRDRGVDVVRVAANGDGVLDPHEVLGNLAQRHIISVLLEAGSGVNGSFLKAELVDRLVLFFADMELGPQAIPFASGGISPYLIQEKLTRTERVTFANGKREDIRIAGYLHDPWVSLG